MQKTMRGPPDQDQEIEITTAGLRPHGGDGLDTEAATATDIARRTIGVAAEVAPAAGVATAIMARRKAERLSWRVCQ